MRHSRWLIEVGRVLAVAGALGLGSAIAWADEDDNNSDQGRAAQEQKDDRDDDSSRDSDRTSRDDSSRNNDRNARDDSSDDDSDSRRDSRRARDDSDDDSENRSSRSSRSSRDDYSSRNEDRDFREGGQQGIPGSRNNRQFQSDNRQFQSNNRQSRGFDDQQWSQDQRQSGGREREVGAKFYTNDDDQITVASVEEDSLAARARLREDDVIISVDGRRFRSEDDLHRYLNTVGSRRVPIIIERDGQRYTVTLNQQQQQNWSNQQQGYAQQWQTDRSADTAWLGVYLDDNENGPVITQVYPQGPAARAGLRAGDVVVQIDGEDITDSDELVEKIEEKDANSRARFTILRDDREFQVSATLVSRNQFAASRGQNQQYQQNQNRGFNEREQYTDFDQNRTQRSGQQNDQWSRGQDQDRGYQTFSTRGQGSQQGYRTADRTAELERQIEELRQEVRELRQSVERR